MSQDQPRRGLGALIQSTTGGLPRTISNTGVTQVSLEAIQRNPNQPRKAFDDNILKELADSIKAKGILQPIMVRTLNKNETIGNVKYEIIAGERRWRASKLAGLSEVPVIIKDVQEKGEILLLSLIENLQRDDLNPIEEAWAYDKLQSDFNLTQDGIAAAVGKSRAAISNALRLLELPDAVQLALIGGRISAGHAKILVGLADPKIQGQIGAKCIAEGLSVRQLENLVGEAAAPKRASVPATELRPRVSPPHIEELEHKLRNHFGTRVRVEEGVKRGRIVIEFYSVDDFDRITGLMGLTK